MASFFRRLRCHKKEAAFSDGLSPNYQPTSNAASLAALRLRREGEKLAKISGGVYYPITQIGQIQKAYDDIVTQLRTAYNVNFRSALEDSGNGASPKLKIKAKRDNTFTSINSVKVVPGN